MPITFFSEDIDFHLTDPLNTSKWIADIVSSEECSLSDLNYIFCSDQYLHKINLEYLTHDTYTDIITFNQSEEDDVIEADIFISIDRVRDNSQSLDLLFDQELHRVLIHGVLHLMGFDDKTSEEKEAMRKKEDTCLSLHFH